MQLIVLTSALAIQSLASGRVGAAVQPAIGLPSSPAESLMALAAGRRAQAEYESRRRRLLPEGYGGGGRCDVRIGRFCYWYDDHESTPPVEPAGIAALRDSLNARLARAASAIPGDSWIAGQRVRYLVEAKDLNGALAAASSCAAAPSWCGALRGFVNHARGETEAADSAYAMALAAMPERERCTWEDISELLPDRASKAYRGADCAARRAMAQRVWVLADPRWTVTGNDRRTEHYSRFLLSQLDRQSRSPYDMSWGEDMQHMVVRFGWPSHWSRLRGSLSDASIHVIGHEPHPAFEFFPGDSAHASPRAVETAAWEFRARDARSRYAPEYASRVTAIDALLTRFPRGDSMIVVVAFDVSNDTSLASPEAEARAAVLDSAGALVAAARVRAREGRGVARFVVAEPLALLGVEVADSARRSLGIAREALEPITRGADGVRLSDPLLYHDPRASDASLDDVLPRAAGSARLRRGSTIGLYWELEREAASADTVSWTVTVVPRDAGLMRRIARALRLRPGAAPVHVSFREPLGASLVVPRALALDLRALPSGAYDLVMSGATSAGVRASASRRLDIVSR